ncbi:heterodisulfide reductase-related iron-sulfur binding cluster [Nocardioides sp. LHG3406-4]|uniref:(Fe-S)-binding protein n=1 Tax=Nocardioides sp. LHG3406-4 TaxID=2804575 RepID=UPI003CF604AB
MQIIAIVVSLALTVAAVALLVPAVRTMLGVIRTGQPAPGRSANPAGRFATMLKETVLHTRMLQWTVVGIMHWFVFAAFIFLSTAVLAAYFQLFKPDFAWPVVGHWYPFEWFSEIIGLLSTVGIVYLIVYRQRHHPRSDGRKSRFFGSTMWQAYFVEALALLEGSAILFVRAAEWKLDEEVGRSHYPIASWLGDALYPVSASSLENLIYAIATFKIALAMVWLMVIARNLTMGIAWHRFTAWFNIYYKREPDGRTALGAMKPLTSAGVPVTLDDIEEMDEDAALGVGKVEDFSWKGILDFTTCTECGRCQSQCPAWNTEKPLSPKLLITAMRDHAYAKAPYLQAGSDEARAALLEGNDTLTREVERPLVGDTGDGWFYMPDDGSAVIDPDVLWSCTSCGACVQQCPVDIEHVDHIMDMRRHQVLVEANFPAELNQLFKGLENKGNPWNMSSSARLDWAKDLSFEVKVVGDSIESLDEVDWLFWVGCAGAYEDRAKKTTRAVAELLDLAGVSFGVLGNGETCTGDPARRAGNEFVFQGLATQNAETFKEYKVKKVVSTCAHCFNTLKNEYKDFGVELEVVHHTQLLNRLVREGRLTPIKDGAGASKRKITYHDPCFLGRHNRVYSPPRDLLQVLPGAEYAEMERHSEKSFCCGAGGARMWMEENIGERINVNRTQEAVGTGADQIAVGCPFCRVMLSDGLTAEQAAGNAREEVEVLDVAQMLLASVKGEPATRSRSSAGTPSAAAGAATVAQDEETKAEPEPGDVTQTAETVTQTADVGPAAKASGGSSLFDVGGDSPAAPTQEKKAEPEAATGGSLFDVGDAGDAPAEDTTKSEPEAEKVEQPKAAPAAASGGSLFDIAADDAPAEAAEPTPAPQTQPEAKGEPTPAPEPVSSSGSLFDIAAPEPVVKAQPTGEPEAKVEEPQAAPEAAAEPATAIPEGGSLFDITAPEPAASAPEPEADPEPEAIEEEPSVETTPAATTATSIPEGGSLFDIGAPEPATPSTQPEATEEVPPERDEEETEPDAQHDDSLSGGAALTRAATFGFEDEDDADDESETEPETGDEEEPEPEPQHEPGADEPDPTGEEEPTPAQPAPATGPAHAPRTDVEINESGSLFDL